MSNEITQQYTMFADLPILTEDERDDARFRGKDLAWAALAALYDERVVEDGLTFEALGARIGLSKQQVQRWIDSPHNMTLQSVSLIAEGLDADLVVQLPRRAKRVLYNTCHPADEAKANAPFHLFYENQVLMNPTTASSSRETDILSWDTL